MEYQCTCCGGCCHDLYVEVAPNDTTPRAFCEMKEWDGARYFYGMKQRENGSCLALDEKTNLCTIHEMRPQVCREFKAGQNLCLRLQKVPKV